jgi:hypothetical protein
MKNLRLIRVRSKQHFTRRTKKDIFKTRDLVLRWDAKREEKPKHGKFDNLWFGPFKIAKIYEQQHFCFIEFG